ncbi:hypothetical protein [Legionella jordanis]|nr:hypothetical protein [Legionella jordanis]
MEPLKFPYQLIELTHTLPSTGSFVMAAFPLKIRRATEAPMRLIGLLP